MSLYFLDNGGVPQSLDGALSCWRSHRPYWHLREVPDEPDDLGTLRWLLPRVPTYRRAEVQEIAEALVADPKIEAALKAMDSPVAKQIEYAVASQFFSPADAQLLTEGLHLALKYVMDRSKPLWKRADVLMGVGAALLLVVVIVLIVRRGAGRTSPTA